jgi:hypothetical protein
LHPEPVTVRASFLRAAGQGSADRQFTLSPRSRLTLRVDEIAGLESAEISIIVTSPSTHPIIVERTMRWDSSGYGAHTDKASAGPSTRWYFAEGSQGFFSTFLLLALLRTPLSFTKNSRNWAGLRTARVAEGARQLTTRALMQNQSGTPRSLHAWCRSHTFSLR